MAIILDKDAHSRLCVTVGKRLRAARVSAKMSEQEVADRLGHKNATQVCLAERGEGRIPPLLSMVMYADLYGVSIDYLVGRVDDPMADPVETNQGAIKRSVVNSIEGAVGLFVEAVASLTVSSISCYQNDKIEFQRVLVRLEELSTAFTRFKELNPTFEEDMRGSARVETALSSLLQLVRQIVERMERENRAEEIESLQMKVDFERLGLCKNSDENCCNAN